MATRTVLRGGFAGIGPTPAKPAPATTASRGGSGSGVTQVQGYGSTPIQSPAWSAPAAAASPPPSSGGGSAPSLTLHADTNSALTALTGRYNKHLDDLSGNTGEIMDTAGSRIRDAREGGRRALQEDALFANRASDPALASYDAATTGAQAGAIADIAQGREANLTNALVGGVGVMGAPAEMALKEKGQQINAYSAENAAKAATSNMAFQQWMALLNAQRSSPIYTG